MLPEKFDTTIAHKIINLMPELSGTDKRIAATILEHFNRRTARCDPGLDRIAWLVGVSRRTAIRSLSHIVRAGVFRVVRHGGYSQRNSYEPVWLRFRELDAVWKMRFRTKSGRADHPKMSPNTCQTRHLPGDQPDTQTFLTNQSQETSSCESASVKHRLPCKPTDRKGQPIKENRSHETGSVPSRSISVVQTSEAAHVAAERRWNSELLRRYSATPGVYAAFIDAITPELQRAATEAEVRRRGSGIALILEQLQISSPPAIETRMDVGEPEEAPEGANHE
jgi:hypothetical protein